MQRVGLLITSGKLLLRCFTKALKYLLFLRMQCMSLRSVGDPAEPSTGRVSIVAWHVCSS